MRTKKTVKIFDLVTEVNRLNRESTCKAELRQGWNSFLEDILHKAGVYSGFGYLNASVVPQGQEPGIKDDGQGGYTFPDETRRNYGISQRAK